MAEEIVLTQQPVRIDGVDQSVLVEDRAWAPESVLEHQFIPLETVLVKEIDNDLIYTTSYWAVDRWWRAFLPSRTYELMISKFLQGREIVIDYRIAKAPRVFMPRERKVSGFKTLYDTTVQDLKTMDAEQLEYHLSRMEYDPLWAVGGYKSY